MAEHTAKRPAEQEMSHLAALVLGFAVLAVVLVVPLLLDLGNLQNTYYFPKARALYILAPLIVLAVGILRTRQPHLTDRGIVIPAVLFMVFAGAATVFGVNPSWSLWGAPWRSEGLLTLLTYPVVLVGTMALVRLGCLRLWLASALTGATVVAGYGIAQYFGHEWLVRDFQRVDWWQAFSTTGNMNYLGGYMALLLPVAVVAVVTARRRVSFVLSMVAVVAMHLAALFTYSRAAWASLLAAFVGMTVLFSRDSQAGIRRYLATLAMLGVITVTFFLPGGPLAPRPTGAVLPLARAQSALEVSSLSVQVRTYLWRKTLPLLVRRPLLGYGPEAFSLVFPQTWDEEKQRIFGAFPMTMDKAHNDSLDMAMSIGLLGLGAYWWLLVACLRRGWRAVRSRAPDRLVALACVVGIVAFWVDLQFGFSIVSVAPVFWSVLGVAAALPHTEARR